MGKTVSSLFFMELAMEKLLIYPLFCMMLLYVTTYLLLIVTRVKFVKSKQVKMSYFKNYIRSEDMPNDFFTPTRLLNNLYEAPILFFAVCAVAIALKYVSTLFLIFSWGFVITRSLHALVLLKSDNITLRFQVFLSSMLSLVGMWVLVLLRAINS